MNEIDKRNSKILYESFGLCGCSEEVKVRDILIKVLTWANDDMMKRLDYDKLFISTGVFYILIGILTNLNFIEHGCSCRDSWITLKGRQFLVWLKHLSNDFQNDWDNC